MTTRRIMLITCLAMLPGALTYTWLFGAGVLLNLLCTSLTALAAEACMLRLRRLPLQQLGDGTALVTGIILGLCLPPLLPLWMAALGTAFALIFGKHMYGGTGNNLFNPAMVGFAVLIVSFPLAMSHWPAPGSSNTFDQTLVHKVTLTQSRPVYDGITAATPLDAYKFRKGLTNEEFFQTEQAEHWQSWALVSLAYLAGGLVLVYLRLAPWQTPLAMLGTLAGLGVVFYDSGSSVSLGSPLFHLTTGAAVFAAFFVVTDPVTAPRHRSNLLLYGAGIGLVTFIIRTIGAYPEGVAFGVLLLNACVPLIDQLRVEAEATVESRTTSKRTENP